MASLLWDFLWGRPPRLPEREPGDAVVHTSPEGTTYINANELKGERAFREQVRDFSAMCARERPRTAHSRS